MTGNRIPFSPLVIHSEDNTPNAGQCDICGSEGTETGVREAPHPGGIFVACRSCSKTEAVPWLVAVLAAARMGGRHMASPPLQAAILDTCKIYDRSLDRFDADVDVEKDNLELVAKECSPEEPLDAVTAL